MSETMAMLMAVMVLNIKNGQNFPNLT